MHVETNSASVSSLLSSGSSYGLKYVCIVRKTIATRFTVKTCRPTSSCRSTTVATTAALRSIPKHSYQYTVSR